MSSFESLLHLVDRLPAEELLPLRERIGRFKSDTERYGSAVGDIEALKSRLKDAGGEYGRLRAGVQQLGRQKEESPVSVRDFLLSWEMRTRDKIADKAARLIVGLLNKYFPDEAFSSEDLDTYIFSLFATDETHHELQGYDLTAVDVVPDATAGGG